MTTSSYESLSHSKWDCKYHVVFVPKYRKKVLYGKIRKYLGPLFHDLASHRSCKILEGQQLHGNSAGEKGISTESVFGLAAMLFQPWVSKKRKLRNISEAKNNSMHRALMRKVISKF
jgi:Transposase IS200 like